MTRSRVALLNLFFTALLAAALSAVMLLAWYPGDYFALMGGRKLLALLTGCDLVLGVLLAMLVHDAGKTRLAKRVDALALAAVRVAALGFGLHVVADSRPVGTVFSIDRFNIVSAGEMAAQEWGGQQTRLFSGPRMAALEMPTDDAGRSRALDIELSGAPLHTLPEYLRPYDATAALRRAQPIPALMAARPEAAERVKRRLAEMDIAPDDAAWLPTQTRFGFATALLRRPGGALVGFVDVDPYPDSNP